MSQYTTQLRYLLESSTWTDEKLGLSSYPIFDEAYRTHLNNLIKDTFYFEEIGFETPARFAFRLKQTMNLNMPYFNQFYKSALLEISPFINVNTNDTTLSEVIKAISEALKQTEQTDENKTEDNKYTKTSNLQSEETSNSSNERELTSENVTDMEKNTNLTETNSGKDNTTSTVNKSITSKDGGSEHTDNDVAESIIESDTPNGLLSVGDINDNIYADKYTHTHSKNNVTNTFGKTNESTETSKDTSETTFGKITETSHSGHDTDSSTNTENENVLNVLEKTNKTTTDDSFTQNNTTNDILEKLLEIAKNINSNENSKVDRNINGFSGITQSKMLLEFRETFLNIDSMVIDSLRPLFIAVLN